MSGEVKKEVDLRKYLLGMLDETQTEEIEEILVSEEEYFQKLQITESELIQDFVDEKLTNQEKKAFSENFILTEERKEQINFSRALRKVVNEKSISETEKKPSFFESLKSFMFAPIPAVCAGLMIFGVSFFVWWNYPRQSEILIALNKSQKNERPTDARISDFDYARKTEGTRGNDKEENLELVSAKARATESVLKNPSAENYHELGRVYLAERNFDESIKQFEKAVKLNPNIAKLNNDLGVALMEKGRQKDEGSLELYARANESIEKSIEQDKNLKEAYFNRALVIELLTLPNQAKEAWENYLKLDSTSKWADEARERLKKLEENKPISKTKEEVLQDFLEAKKANDTEKAWQTLSRNREMITGKLIPQQLAFLFVDAKAEGNEAQAKEYLDALIYAGELEERKVKDAFWRNLANHYTQLSEKKILQTKEAHQIIKESIKLRKEFKYLEALEKTEVAKNKFTDLNNSIESLLCDYWISVYLFQLNQLEESDSICESLIKVSEKFSYKWFAAINHIRLAYSTGSKNNYTESISQAQKALKYAEEISDTYDTHRALTIIANRTRVLGQYENSLKFSEKSLTLGKLPEAVMNQKWFDYESITGVFQGMGYYHSASLFQLESLFATRLIGERHNEQVSNWYLAQIKLLQKDFEEAEKFINESIRLAESLPNQASKEKALAQSRIIQGILNRLTGNYEESISNLSQACAFFDTSQFQLFKYNSHKERFLSYLQTKNTQKIEDELKAILEIFRKNREKILEEQKRNSFFEDKQNIYDLAVEYEYDKGFPQQAFDYSEESRSRSLLDLRNSLVAISKNNQQPEINILAKNTKPLGINQIQLEIPQEVQFLQYTVLKDKLIIWNITKEKLLSVQKDFSTNVLEQKITELNELISKNLDPEKQKDLAKELYQILISPIKQNLDSNKEIFIIPDKFLFQLSFATLFSERYLIEEYKISYTPSVNIFLSCYKKAKELERNKEENLLTIGNPAFKNEFFSDLEFLPLAKQESVEISKLYQNPVMFAEETAQKKIIRPLLKNADIIHFAGHYVVDEQNPLLSGLVLSGKTKEESLFTNYEIISEKLDKTKLIILSACQTGVEKYIKGEGMIGASRTFLATDVPLILATYWQIDSTASSELMVNFHTIRKRENLSVSNALRQAQINMIKSEKYNLPYYWASFFTVGGYTKY